MSRVGAVAAASLCAAGVALSVACTPPQASVQVGTPRQVSSPSEPAPVTPRAGQWPTEVQARVGQPVIFRLPGTAGTGYTWLLASPPCEALPLAYSQQLENSKDGRVGGPSEWVFTFTADSPGTCAVTFHYRRPWERGIAPAETRSVTVSVVAP